MANTLDSTRRARPLLGTFVEIAAQGPDLCQLERAVEAAFDAIQRVHRLMSYHEPDSDVSRLNRAEGRAPIAIHAWTHSVLQASLGLQALSGGLFDIAVAPALERLGFLPRSSAVGLANSYHPDRRGAVELSAGNQARLSEANSRIDLGGIAKGFAVDQALKVLRRYGVSGALVNAGGDLAAFGAEDHPVAIRDPRDPARALAVVTLRDAALATSGPPFDPVLSGSSPNSAIIDPFTGRSATGICGATVRAASCMIADAMTKVVVLAGTSASDILETYGASAMFVSSSGEVLATSNWQDGPSLAA